MFTCSEIESRLMAILEGDLAPDDRERADAHLRQCIDCRELIARYQPLFQFDAATARLTPETLWRNIQEKLNSLDKGRRSQPTLFPRRRPLFGYLLQASGIAAAIMVGIVLGATPDTSEASYEEEVADYYAEALSNTTLPVDEVYQAVSEGVDR